MILIFANFAKFLNNLQRTGNSIFQMNIIYPNDTFIAKPCVTTVGFFDGVHAGHRFLIEELKNIARTNNLESTVVTFSVHPRKVLNSTFKPDLLTNLEEKLEQLATTGINNCVVIEFNTEMAQLTAFDFLKKILFDKLNSKILLVGHDHRFGHNREDGFQDYKIYGDKIGIEVIKAQRHKTNEDRYISSSEVRVALEYGNIDQANRLLTYPYTMQGKVVDGFKIGRKIGFPTANLKLEDPDKLIPGSGVYAVLVNWNKLQFTGMLNIGNRPTVNNGNDLSIEVHIIDFKTEIYNEYIEIKFIQKIRDEKRFNNIDELIKQLKADKEKVIGLKLS